MRIEHQPTLGKVIITIFGWMTLNAKAMKIDCKTVPSVVGEFTTADITKTLESNVVLLVRTSYIFKEQSRFVTRKLVNVSYNLFKWF